MQTGEGLQNGACNRTALSLSPHFIKYLKAVRLGGQKIRTSPLTAAKYYVYSFLHRRHLFPKVLGTMSHVQIHHGSRGGSTHITFAQSFGLKIVIRCEKVSTYVTKQAALFKITWLEEVQYVLAVMSG